MINDQLQLRCMLVICERGAGDSITRMVKDYAHFQSIILGRGTASSEIMTTLGLNEPEKDIIFCFIEKHNVEYVFSLLEENFELTKKHRGIAMTIPVSAVGGFTTMKLLCGNENCTENNANNRNENNAVVNSGAKKEN